MERRRPHLTFGRGSLAIGGVAAKELADEYGTPLYVTDLDRVVQRYDAAAEALTAEHSNTLIAFAFKSNPMKEVVEALAARGGGGTVVSVAGIELARECGVPMGKVVFDGPSKTRKELEAGIRAGVGTINAESIQEVLDIESLCEEIGVERCRVGFRANFGIEADTHPGLATGSRSHKFGVGKDEIVGFCRREGRKLRRAAIVGLHSHLGSQISDLAIFRKGAEEMVKLAEELRKAGTEIEEFNLGGGLGVDYGGGENEVDVGDFAEATAGIFARSGRRGEARLVFELGRWIVADSTVLLTRVNYLKRVGATNWALVDAGMNDFIRPALYGARHEVVPAWTASRVVSKRAYDVGGPVCESSDVFGRGRKLGVALSRGDVLAILDTGAYGSSMASTYNMRPIPRTVLVSNGKGRLAEQ